MPLFCSLETPQFPAVPQVRSGIKPGSPNSSQTRSWWGFGILFNLRQCAELGLSGACQVYNCSFPHWLEITGKQGPWWAWLIPWNRGLSSLADGWLHSGRWGHPSQGNKMSDIHMKAGFQSSFGRRTFWAFMFAYASSESCVRSKTFPQDGLF